MKLKVLKARMEAAAIALFIAIFFAGYVGSLTQTAARQIEAMQAETPLEDFGRDSNVLTSTEEELWSV